MGSDEGPAQKGPKYDHAKLTAMWKVRTGGANGSGPAVEGGETEILREYEKIA